MVLDSQTLERWRHHLQDEADAAYLYRILARAEKNDQRSGVFNRLAQVEDRHTGLWQKLLAEQGHEASIPSPSFKARVMARAARWLGPASLLSLLLREEGQEVKGYFALYRESPPGAAKDTALTLAKESAEHAGTLGKIAGTDGEPWHSTESGGFLRNVIYGFNDGLTANFGLVAGVIGASVDSGIVIVTGLAVFLVSPGLRRA